MIAVDTHVHLDARQSAADLFAQAAANLEALAPAGTSLAIVLTERAGCGVFAARADGRGAGGELGAAVAVAGDAVRVGTRSGDLWVLPGRQVATAERLEVLALGVSSAPPDGMPADRVIEAACAAGAVPVLPWAVGKWLGARGRRVAALASRFADAGLLLADSALRPCGWPMPLVMQAADRLLAGTDPLPLPGEEGRAGRYGVLLDAVLDASAPCRSTMAALRDRTIGCRRIGRRLGPVAVARRMVLLRLSRAGHRP